MSEQGMILGADDGILYKRNNEMRVKIASEHTNGTYEICEEKCPPGFTSRRHMHLQDWETFYIVDGSATWEVGDETVEATKGTTVHLPPKVPHKVFTKDGCTMLCVFGPGNQAGMFEEMNNLTPEEAADPAVRKKITDRHHMMPLED